MTKLRPRKMVLHLASPARPSRASAPGQGVTPGSTTLEAVIAAGMRGAFYARLFTEAGTVFRLEACPDFFSAEEIESFEQLVRHIVRQRRARLKAV